MYNLDDKNLDRLSKEAADNFLPPGAPSWEKLQQRLDKELPVREEKRRRGFILFFILTGVLLGGAFLLYTQLSPVSQKQAINTVPVTAPSSNTSNDNNSNNVATSSDNKNQNEKANVNVKEENTITTSTSKPTNTTVAPDAVIATEKAKPVTVTNSNNTVTNKNHTEGNIVADKQLPATKSARNKNAFNNSSVTANVPLTTIAGSNKNASRINSNINTKQSRSKTTTSGKNNQSDVATSNNKNGTEEIAKNNGNTTPPVANNTVTTTPVEKPNAASNNTSSENKETTSDAPKTDKADKTDRKAVAKTDTPPAKNKKQTSAKNEKAISVGLLVGTDYSTVKYEFWSSNGINLGLTAGYHFNKNWSAQTGLIYTKKNYKMGQRNYSPPTPVPNLDYVDGSCNMWELPLSARYTFNSNRSSKFFVSTGVSSYFMKLQHYIYNYKLPGGQAYERAWDDDDNVDYWLSTLSITAGVEKSLSKRLSLQVEPYAKLPLKGVGFGAMKLSSFGINLSVQLKQPLKK